jgi:Flp pilus assembly protein CpaB
VATLTAAAPAPRRLVRRLPRLDTRLVVGLLLVALSVLGGLRLSAGADHRVAVFAAARDLPADHVLEPGDVTSTRVHVPAAVLDGLLRANEGLAPTGQALRFPVEAGDLLTDGALAARRGPGREMTVPIAPEHALGGALEPGDRVDVLASFDKGTEIAKTLTVASRVQVVDVVRADGLFGQSEGDVTAVTLSVRPDDVVLLAFAVRNGEIDLVRSQGRPTPRVRARFDASDIP